MFCVCCRLCLLCYGLNDLGLLCLCLYLLGLFVFVCLSVCDCLSGWAFCMCGKSVIVIQFHPSNNEQVSTLENSGE